MKNMLHTLRNLRPERNSVKLGLITATKFDTTYDYNNLTTLGVSYLGGMVKQEIPNSQVVIKEQIEEIIQEKPDIVGISSLTENYYIAIKWAKLIKIQLNVPIIIGGVHISLIPESLTDDFDVAVIGEGEITLVELLKSYIENGHFNHEIMLNIDGLCFRHNGQIVLTEKRELVKDLDTLPRLKRNELPFNKRTGIYHILSARGCPYKCSFCASAKFFQRYRSHSAEYIVEEIEYLIKKEKAQFISFYDDLLITNKKKLRSIIEKLEEKKLINKCGFGCQVRANLVNEEICQLLKRLNVTEVGIGLESFSDKILTYYKKSGVNAEKNQRALDLLTENGIKPNPCFIFGAPDETKDDMLETFRAIYRNLESKRIGGAWGLLRPYPGTEIWEWAISEGIVNNDMDWEKFSDWSNFKLYLNSHLSRNEFVELIDEWITKYTLLVGRYAEITNNIIINDAKSLFNNVSRFKKIVRNRVSKGEAEIGDDLLIKPNPILFMKGVYEGENGWFWTTKTSEVIVACDNSDEYALEILVPDYFSKIRMLPITVSVYNLEQELIVEENFISPGIYSVWIRADHQEKELTYIKICTNRSFIPLEKNVSDDNRELSLYIKFY